MKKRLFSLLLAFIFTMSIILPCCHTIFIAICDNKKDVVINDVKTVKVVKDDPLIELDKPVSVTYESVNEESSEEELKQQIEEEIIDVVKETPAPSYKDFDAPNNSGFKSYMSYKCITSKSSPQYKLQNERAYTGEYGIRQVDGRFCVALGSYFTTEIGTYFDLILENGTVIPCILADQKADKDTDSQNIITNHNGCLSEFVVDLSVLHSMSKRMGDVSYCNDSWNSPVKIIRVYY